MAGTIKQGQTIVTEISKKFSEADLSSPRFDQPPCEPQAKVFICAAPRTGSWLLCRAMIHHGMGVPHEYFNARHVGIIGPRFGINALSQGTLLQSDAHVRREYARTLIARRTVNSVFSAKIHWGQYNSYLNNPEGDELLRNSYFIHLYRDDLLAQAISFHISRLTGRWGLDATSDTPPVESPRFFDVDHIDVHLKAVAEAETNWRRFFAENGINPLRISYERLLVDLPGVIRDIVDRGELDVPQGLPDYVEEGPDGVRDENVPPRSEIRAAFVRAKGRVRPASAISVPQTDEGDRTAKRSSFPDDLGPPSTTTELNISKIDQFHVQSNRRNTICLCMIVRNEASVITRCLASVRSMFDYWVIVDTGSTDGTQNIVKEYLQDIPGELHERPWVDFAHNRSEALDLARPHANYALIIDADDVIELPPGFKMPFLSADSYLLQIWNKTRHYWRPQLLRSSLPWRYEGVLHEFLSCGTDKDNQRVFAESRSQSRLKGAKIIMSEEGARRRVSATDRFGRDAAILEKALLTETDPFLIARYTFYLAQSYLDAGNSEKALEAYQARSKLGFWDQEIYISLCRSANLKADLGHDFDEVIQTYREAERVDSRRAEALHGAARFCRILERFQDGYEFAKRALQMQPPDDGLFVEQWIYDYGVLDEYAVNAYWMERHDECLKACRRILTRSKMVPAADRARIEKNAGFAHEKLLKRR